jgi:Na+-driven multidrug efflux pump
VLPVHALDILIIIDHLWMHLMLKDKLQVSRTMDNDQTSIVVLSNIHHNLNHNPTLNAVVDEDGDDNAADDDEKRQSTFYIRILDHLYIACPVISTFVLRKSIDVVSVISVGHLGPHYLAAAGLASVTANVTGNSMIIGLAGALTTICSQAYGSKDYKEMSDSLQRSVLILYVVICLPVSVLWMFSQPIMLLLGQPEAIARDAQRYLVCLIPNLWLLSTSFCIQNWLHAQSKARGIAMISLFLAVLHPICCDSL